MDHEDFDKKQGFNLSTYNTIIQGLQSKKRLKNKSQTDIRDIFKMPKKNEN